MTSEIQNTTPAAELDGPESTDTDISLAWDQFCMEATGDALGWAA